jgi:uncharacterized repeat protein (TIGR03803 family)
MRTIIFAQKSERLLRLAALGVLVGCAGAGYQTPEAPGTPSLSVRGQGVRSTDLKVRRSITYSEMVLHDFTTTRFLPSGTLIQGPGGALYGTVESRSGGCECGSVYKFTSGTVTDLYDFTGGTDGSTPTSGVIRDSSGALYGTTERGGGAGSCSCGTVFKLTSSGTSYSETVIHRFTPTGGNLPTSGLTMDTSGDLYGVTTYGGTGICEVISGPTGCGVVYKLTRDGSSYDYSILHHFSETSGEGFWPTGTLVLDSSGSLYGTTSAGGILSDCKPAGISQGGQVHARVYFRRELILRG